MNKAFQYAQSQLDRSANRVDIVTRSELKSVRAWTKAFANQRKDHRYFEIVEDTIQQGFEHKYFTITDTRGHTCAVQPFFLLDQDMLAGTPRIIKTAAGAVRRHWPRFMLARTLMVGCAAGEGHLDRPDERLRRSDAKLLAAAIERHALDLGADLVVLKEFPQQYREPLECFAHHGFTRIPSLPMVRLKLDYANFEDYLKNGVSRKMRSDLRRKFRDAGQAAPIEMSVVRDVTPIIDDIYPLYLQVHERSALQFEKLTKDYLCALGQRMPDKVRFFIWRQSGRPVAFSLSMVNDDTVYNEYLGLDYAVALKLHLYFYAFRDVMSWAIAHGYRYCVSGGCNYEPKSQLGFRLLPLDLYVRHTSPVLNAALKWVLPLLEPTHYVKPLRLFPNYNELWGSGPENFGLKPPGSSHEPRAPAIRTGAES